MKIGVSISFRLKRIQFSVSILIIPLIIVLMAYNSLLRYLIILTFISIHEFGHIAAALLLGSKLYGIKILPIGLNASIDNSCCYKRDRILIYLAGPCINLLIGIIFVIIYMHYKKSGFLSLGIMINVWLAFFNLLPVLPLDGGKILMEILAGRVGVFRASKYINIFSIILSSVIIVVVFFILEKSIFNVSLILIGAYILFSIGQNKKESAFMNVRNLVYRRSRIIKKGIYPAREIVVMKNIKMSDIIKAIDYTDMFHIINVLDDDLRVMKVMTEQEILNAIMENDSDITFDRFLGITR